MAFARGACDFIRCCFVLSADDDDDTERIVEFRVPPVDGSAVPRTDDDPHRFEMDLMLQMFSKRLDAVKNEQEKQLVEVADALRSEYGEQLIAAADARQRELDALRIEFGEHLTAAADARQRELGAFRNEYEEHLITLAVAHRRDVDDLDGRVTAAEERGDRFDSRINTLNEQLRYEEPNFPTYSDNYVHQEQEVMPPQFSP